MKNPAPYIREALVTLLHHAVTYNTFPVPCYEGEGEEEDPYQIFLANQTKTSQQNRDAFLWNCEQRIEVISEQVNNTHEHVDAIAEGVLNLLKPTPKTSGLTSSADFQIINVTVDISDYMDENSGQGTIINRLPLNVKFLVTQVNNN